MNLVAVQKHRVAAARLAAGCLSLLVTGCGSATSGGLARGISPAPSVTTLMAGWQEKFDIDWQAKPEPGGTKRVQGYIVSRYGRSAEPVRVLVQALDASGAAVGYRIAWVPGGVPGFGRAYFEVAVPAADRYQVSVWDYSLLREPSSS